MNIRKVDLNRDYELIASWWKARTDTIPPRDILSNDGWMASNNGMDLAAMWLFPIENCKVAWVGWPIASPGSSKKSRNEALDLVFDKIHDEATQRGFKYIWTTSGVSPIKERLVRHGYKIGDTKIDQFWKGL